MTCNASFDHYICNNRSIEKINNAGNTATEVACGWAGARGHQLIWAEAVRSKKKNHEKVKCDQPTDRPTDKAGCRVACTRLKMLIVIITCHESLTSRPNIWVLHIAKVGSIPIFFRAAKKS